MKEGYFKLMTGIANIIITSFFGGLLFLVSSIDPDCQSIAEYFMALDPLLVVDRTRGSEVRMLRSPIHGAESHVKGSCCLTTNLSFRYLIFDGPEPTHLM